MNTVYKVTNKDRASCIVYNTFAGIQYDTESFVTAHPIMAGLGYYILAFKDLESARAFVSDGIIWKAETSQEIITDLPPRKWGVPMSEKEVDTIMYYESTLDWPKGTVMCKDLRLVERLTLD